MKLVVGLGNPGKKYEKTRHNVGYMVLDAIASQISNYQNSNSIQIQNLNFQTSKNAKAEYLGFKVGKERIELIKPLTFMNESGFSVVYARNKHKVSDDKIYIIHDDLDIKLGEYKIQKGKGPRVHKGLLSIYEKLGTKNFWHVRIGIENRKGVQANHTMRGRRIPGEDYVLQNFTGEELVIINKVAGEVANEMIKIITN